MEFSPDQVRELEELMELCNLQTRKELFNVALSVFGWAVKNVHEGNKIASINSEKESYEVLNTPAFDSVMRKSRYAGDAVV